MTVSIIISTFNRSALLLRCLTAIVKQISRRDLFEVVVVDDGSSGSEAAIMREYCTARSLTYVRNDVNRGMAVGRNKGIENSHGEWLVFLDDDVVVGESWGDTLVKTVARLPETVIGFEGRVEPSGDGLWDKEVQNRSGRLFLTCHMGYRKETLESIGRFDPQFEFEGPYAEDHELAARALPWGEIVFVPELVVTHLPRTVRLHAYFRGSRRRITRLLNAEMYFYTCHPDRYHQFRTNRTFWGTYRSVLSRHLVNELRRRAVSAIVKHPVQSATLIASGIVEQCSAWLLLPRMAVTFLKRRGPFEKFIDARLTRRIWQMRDGAPIDSLRMKRSTLKSVFFPLLRRPSYCALPVLKKIRVCGGMSEIELFLRIDDVFLSTLKDAVGVCGLLADAGVPFLAAVKGDDLLHRDGPALCETIRGKKGVVGLHGFSHAGKFGPFDSEIMQMSFAQLEAKIAAIREHSPVMPDIFVAPFNAISASQISWLSGSFKVICGGPETARFTDAYLGPAALTAGGIYFPSYYPFYNSARGLVESGILEKLPAIEGFVCITLHLQTEAADQFKSLRALVAATGNKIRSWDRLMERQG